VIDPALLDSAQDLDDLTAGGHNLHLPGWSICVGGHKPLPLAIVSSHCRLTLRHSVAVPKTADNGVFGTLGYVLGTFAAQRASNPKPGTADRFFLG
jgi:hypothetical protein